MSDTENHQPPSLLSRPDIAQEIGFLIIYCANLEAWILPALSELLRGKSRIAAAILEPVENLGAKLGVVFNIAAERDGVPLALDLLANKDSTLKAVAFRNTLAHGHFGFGNGLASEMQLISNMISTRRGKPKSKALTCEAIREHVESLRSMISAIRLHAGSDLWVGFPESASPDEASRPNRPASKRQPGR